MLSWGLMKKFLNLHGSKGEVTGMISHLIWMQGGPVNNIINQWSDSYKFTIFINHKSSWLTWHKYIRKDKSLPLMVIMHVSIKTSWTVIKDVAIRFAANFFQSGVLEGKVNETQSLCSDCYYIYTACTKIFYYQIPMGLKSEAQIFLDKRSEL